MTQSLTERLSERLATQSAEIEALTASELKRLGQRLTSESEAALASMRSATQAAIESATRPLIGDLARLRRVGRWWWGTLALSWATIAGLMGLSLWLWMGPGMGAATTGPGGDEPYPTFVQDGETYMVLPEGAQPTTCRQGELVRPCVVLPTLEMMMRSTSGAAAGETATTPTSEGPTSVPIARPPARPGGS